LTVPEENYTLKIFGFYTTYGAVEEFYSRQQTALAGQRAHKIFTETPPA